MRLHTNIRQTNIGMIKSKPAWQLFFNVELTPDEAELVQKYQLGERLLAKYIDNEGNESYLEVRQAVTGKGGHVFVDLGQVNAMKQSLIEGCAHLREYLRQLQEIRGGGGGEIIDFPLHPAQHAGSAPPVQTEAGSSASVPTDA